MNQDKNIRVERLHKTVHDAAFEFAVDYLSEHGGSVRDGIHAARMALQTAEIREVESSQWQNPKLTRRVDQALAKQQGEVREHILSGEPLWIRSGTTTRWHRVATATRAKCGTKINDDDKAWALTNDKPHLRDVCQRCEG